MRQYQIRNTVQGMPKLFKFLQEVIPTQVPLDSHRTQDKEAFIADVMEGVEAAAMSIRLT